MWDTGKKFTHKRCTIFLDLQELTEGANAGSNGAKVIGAGNHIHDNIIPQVMSEYAL